MGAPPPMGPPPIGAPPPLGVPIVSLDEKSEEIVKKIVPKSLKLYNKNGILITLNWELDNKKIISVVIVNNNEFEISKFSLNIIVPKYIQLDIKPMSGTTLLGKGKNNIKQQIVLNNTMHGKQPYTIGVEIGYVENGKEKSDKSEIKILHNDYFNKE
eukprot:288512_1